MVKGQGSVKKGYA